jgi:hypothetical protein
MTHEEQAAEFVKAAPPLTITGMTIMGFSISDWVLFLTAIYTLLQIGLIIRRTWIAHIDRAKAGRCMNANNCPGRNEP